MMKYPSIRQDLRCFFQSILPDNGEAYFGVTGTTQGVFAMHTKVAIEQVRAEHSVLEWSIMEHHLDSWTRVENKKTE